MFDWTFYVAAAAIYAVLGVSDPFRVEYLAAAIAEVRP